jgi:hypothetical protein
MTTAKEKSRKEKRMIPPALMVRIKTCALIFQADKPEKIAAIAQEKGISLDEAGIAYAVSCIKHMKRTGIARNYRDAVDILEARQVGDRGDYLNPPDKLDREVDRISRNEPPGFYTDYRLHHFAGTVDEYGEPVNRHEKQVVRYAGTYSVYNRAGKPVNEPDFLRSIDNGKTWSAVYPAGRQKKHTHTRNMGKIYGSMYTQWEEREAESDPVWIMSKEQLESVQAHRDMHLTLFFTEYMSRLSRTYKERIAELKARPETSGYLAGKAGREDPKTKGIARAAENLFSNFPYKEGLNRREYIDLVRQYT